MTTTVAVGAPRVHRHVLAFIAERPREARLTAWRQPSWWARAACRGMGSTLFFLTNTVIGAQRICARCEVRDECLRYALNNDIPFGLWGGCSTHQRGQLASHGDTSGLTQDSSGRESTRVAGNHQAVLSQVRVRFR